jgi:hypothetical protein
LRQEADELVRLAGESSAEGVQEFEVVPKEELDRRKFFDFVDFLDRADRLIALSDALYEALSQNNFTDARNLIAELRSAVARMAVPEKSTLN